MESAMQHKETETPHFIEHSLLATDLMELMDQTGVFPKAVGATNLTTNGTNNYTDKDSLTPELSFHSSIFQFVNKHVHATEEAAHARVSPNIDPPVGVGPTPVTDNYEHNKDTSDFLNLNSSFLTEPQHINDNTGVPVATFPAHAIEPTVPLHNHTLNNAEDDLLYVPNGRKVLPHKKRISRKLRGSMSGNYGIDISVYNMEPKRALHACEICGYGAETQLDFFAHLKQHYEPDTQHTMLASMKTTLDSLDDSNKVVSLSPRPQQPVASKLDQVFQDVQLSFDDFPNVPNGVGSHNVENAIENLKYGEPNNVETEPAGFVTPTVNELAVKNVTSGGVVDDLEFSDAEDMLEGMRNVVDKVSVEDTCDEIDLAAATDAMRGQWFGNNNFSDISFRNCDEPFAAPAFRQILLSEEAALPRTQSPAIAATNTPNHSPTDELSMNTHNTEQLCFPLPTRNDEQQMPLPIEAQSPITETLEDDNFNEEDTCSDTETKTVKARHISKRLHSDEDDKKKYTCTQCEREFNSYNALKYHGQTHTQERPHQCNICGNSFFALSALKSHLRTHTGEKPFECTHCHRKFRQYGDLKYHTESLHNEVKAHMCEYCGKSFSRKYSLNLHRSIHTSERKFSCDQCPKTFRASSYLSAHLKVHTGEKPYTCSICNKKFRASSDMNRHKRIHQRAADMFAASTGKQAEPGEDH